MIKDMAWNMFKSTGSVDTFLEMKQIENIQNNLANLQKVETNGNSKNEGNNNWKKWRNAKENRNYGKKRYGTKLWNKSKFKNLGKSKRRLDE